MNSLSRQPDPAADEQASLWAARLEGGTLSAADRDALDAWLNADASHRPLLSRYCQFSADLEEQLLALVATGGVKLPPDSETDSTPDSASESAPSTLAPVRRWNFKWAAPIALAAAAAVAVAVWVARPTAKVETIATAVAQRSTITLSDGSRVELNARTSLTFTSNSKERRVRLASGEAFFSVNKDASRPFIIDTPAGAVRVTGTVFNVRSESSANLEVTVVEGSVQVRPGDPAASSAVEPQSLIANDCLSVTGGKTAKRTLTAAELDEALAWRQGQVVFNQVPLRAALMRVANYHGKEHEIIPSAAVEQSKNSVGGRFSIDDLDGFLTSIADTHKLRVIRETSGKIRVSLLAER